MDAVTKAALAMGMFTGEADYRNCEDICVGCGRRDLLTWAGRARDPAGLLRGICSPCIKALRGNSCFVDRVVKGYLEDIRAGRR